MFRSYPYNSFVCSLIYSDYPMSPAHLGPGGLNERCGLVDLLINSYSRFEDFFFLGVVLADLLFYLVSLFLTSSPFRYIAYYELKTCVE